MSDQEWTPERAMRARQAAVFAWQEVTEAGGTPAERQSAWRRVEHACDREGRIKREAEAG